MSAPFAPLNPSSFRKADASSGKLLNTTVEGIPNQSFQPVAFPKTETNPSRAHADHKPGVTCEREGDVIKKIRVQCSCGEIMEILCNY